MIHTSEVESGGGSAARRWRWILGLGLAGLLLARATQSAVPDLAKAEELLQAGRPAEAKALFEQALEADPSSVAAHLGLGRAYYALGEYSRARIEFETVLQFDNLKYGIGQARRGWLEKGDVLNTRGVGEVRRLLRRPPGFR